MEFEKLGKRAPWSFVLTVIVLTSTVDLASATFKRWVPNVDYNNPSNWNTGRLPCQNDKVIFTDVSSPVFVQTNATIQEIVLPVNGELVLGSYMSLSFPTARSEDADCPGSEVQFNRTESKDWFDPANWCEVAGSEGACLSSQPLRLETERVPCKNEGVVFPATSTFLVSLGSAADVFISSLYLAGKSFTTGGFRSFLASQEGQKQFVRESGNPTTVNIVSSSSCSDPTGCMCGNDAGQVQKLVCQSYTDRCPPTPCPSPLTPAGGCCAVCGGILDLDYGANFKISSIQNVITRHYLGDRPDVQLIISKTGTDHIQVVLQDNGGGSQAQWVADKVAQILQDDMRKGRKYGVTDVVLRGSGSSSPSTGARTEKGGLQRGGIIAVIVVAALVLLIVLALAVFCFTGRYKDRLKLPSLQKLKKNSFQRFGSPDDTLEMDDTVSFNDNLTFGRASMRSARSLQGFENPTYDIPMAQEPENIGAGGGVLDPSQPTFVCTDDNSNDAKAPPNTSFLNPLYSQGKKDPYLDASITDTTLRFNPVYSEEGVEEDSKI